MYDILIVPLIAAEDKKIAINTDNLINREKYLTIVKTYRSPPSEAEKVAWKNRDRNPAGNRRHGIHS
jgi:hypothetical protein